MESKMNKNQEKMDASIRSGQEEMRAAMSSIGAKLEESMKCRVENIQMFLDHRMQRTQAKMAEVHRLFPQRTRNC
jgi:hypothetical protein